jgi:hypothetical protein
VYKPLVDDQWPHNPHFVENIHEQPFSIILKAPRIFTKNGLHQKSKNVIHGKETYLGEVHEPPVDDQRPHNPYFCQK